MPELRGLETDVVGNNALIYAGEAPDPEVARALLAAGADPKTKNIARRTPLINAARLGNTATAKALIDAGCELNVDEMYKNGGTALMFAAAGGHAEVVELLLAAGADVNIVHSDTEVNQSYDSFNNTKTTTFTTTSFTALSIARGRGDQRLVAMLTRAGASR